MVNRITQHNNLYKRSYIKRIYFLPSILEGYTILKGRSFEHPLFLIVSEILRNLYGGRHYYLTINSFLLSIEIIQGVSYALYHRFRKPMIKFPHSAYLVYKYVSFFYHIGKHDRQFYHNGGTESVEEL